MSSLPDLPFRTVLNLVIVNVAIDYFLVISFPHLVHSDPLWFWMVTPWNWLVSLGCLLILGLHLRVHTLRYPWRNNPQLWLVAGFISNVLAYLFYGHYVDYLPTGFSYTNTADLMIVAGCIWLAKDVIISSRSQTLPELPE